MSGESYLLPYFICKEGIEINSKTDLKKVNRLKQAANALDFSGKASQFWKATKKTTLIHF